jgi:hypothetical protein
MGGKWNMDMDIMHMYIYNVLLDIYGMDDMENYMGGWTLWI